MFAALLSGLGRAAVAVGEGAARGAAVAARGAARAESTGSRVLSRQLLDHQKQPQRNFAPGESAQQGSATMPGYITPVAG